MEAPQMRSKLLAPAALMLSVLSIAATPIAAGAQPYDHDRRDRDHAPRHKVWVCKDPHRAANTGTVVGALGGALVGSAIAGHGDKLGGALIGGGVGAVAGHQIAKQNAKGKCHWEWRR
jgi:outer membrane lipoprotein SlyB